MLRADTPDSLSLSLRRSIERQHWNTMIVETWTIERNLARCFRRRQRHCKRTDPLCCRTLPLSMPVRCLALIRQRMADDQSSYRKHRWITTPSDIPKSPNYLSPFSPPLYRDGSKEDISTRDEGKEGKKNLYPPSRERGGRR